VSTILLLLLVPAQPSSVEVDRRSMRLSESVRVTLTIQGDAPLRVDLASPLSADSQAMWRVKRAEKPTLTAVDPKQERWSQSFELDPWVVGDPVTLSFAKAKVIAGNGGEQEVGWQSLDIRVSTAIAETRSDSARPVTGIEQLPPLTPPQPESFAWIFLLGIVLVVSAMVVVGIVRRRRMKLPPPPPLEWALAEFDRMEREAASGEALADRVSAVLREFVARKFGIAAPKQTTAELLLDANRAGWPVGLDAILERCDRAKFAGDSLTTEDGRELLARSREWVEAASMPVATVSSSET
jgi:hypothetical protein